LVVEVKVGDIQEQGVNEGKNEQAARRQARAKDQGGRGGRGGGGGGGDGKGNKMVSNRRDEGRGGGQLVHLVGAREHFPAWTLPSLTHALHCAFFELGWCMHTSRVLFVCYQCASMA
jgi:hypothetical protein